MRWLLLLLLCSCSTGADKILNDQNIQAAQELETTWNPSYATIIRLNSETLAKNIIGYPEARVPVSEETSSSARVQSTEDHDYVKKIVDKVEPISPWWLSLLLPIVTTGIYYAKAKLEEKKKESLMDYVDDVIKESPTTAKTVKTRIRAYASSKNVGEELDKDVQRRKKNV